MGHFPEESSARKDGIFKNCAIQRSLIFNKLYCSIDVLRFIIKERYVSEIPRYARDVEI